MTASLVKGFCPGALRPMASGDGLVVRIRPFGGCLSPEQVAGIAELSKAFGNGVIDLSARANVQLRGVSAETHAPLLEGLRALNLLDASEDIERRRNIVVTPFWTEGDATHSISRRLTEALCEPGAPDLPHKFGFAVDTGLEPVLQTASADIRLERAADGMLLVVADGMDTGKPVTELQCVEEALRLARWFMKNRTDQNRMARLIPGQTLIDFDTPRQLHHQIAVPGNTPQGTLAGFAFGQLSADTFHQLAMLGPLRITPWRMVLVEGAKSIPDIDGVITTPDNPLLRITACTGAPACSQALGPTRTLARTLAAHLKPTQHLHISGCAKGCAHPRPAPLTLTATKTGFDLAIMARAGDTPAATDLSTDDIIKAL
ncbi:MAG: precorrin-3B synthase [Sulfitobacter sp.]